MDIRQAKGVFTKQLIRVFTDARQPEGFIRSMFRVTESASKTVSIEVMRDSSKVAVDILRGTNGNRNSVTKMTEREIQPPMYDEFADMTSLEAYETFYGASNTQPNAGTAAAFLKQAGGKLGLLRNKIERAYELQGAQALFDGIVQLSSGDNIDYLRKPASLLDLGGAGYWLPANATVDPRKTFQTACDFLKEEGKMQGGVVNAIMGADAYAALLQMPLFKEAQDIRRVDLGSIHGPQRQSVGGVLHGEISAGSYTIRLWTYPEFYENAAGAKVYYVPTNKMALVPEVTQFDLAYAATPTVMEAKSGSALSGRVVQTKGAYQTYDYIDRRKRTHDAGVMSAGVAILTAVDQVATVQVLAN